MANRCSKIKENIKSKKYSLYSFGIGSIFFIILYTITKLFNISLCPIKNVFGVSCFGCGMTRAFICILEFNFLEAIKYNVLSIPVFFGIVIYFLLTMIDIFFDKQCVKAIDSCLAKKYMFFVYIAILTVSTYMNNYLI